MFYHTWLSSLGPGRLPPGHMADYIDNFNLTQLTFLAYRRINIFLSQKQRIQHHQLPFAFHPPNPNHAHHPPHHALQTHRPRCNPNRHPKILHPSPRRKESMYISLLYLSRNPISQFSSRAYPPVIVWRSHLAYTLHATQSYHRQKCPDVYLRDVNAAVLTRGTRMRRGVITRLRRAWRVCYWNHMTRRDSATGDTFTAAR